jgi:hypothetical protein
MKKMLTNVLAFLSRLVTLPLPRTRLVGSSAPVPLDPIERLQRHGGGLPLMIEFARTGW